MNADLIVMKFTTVGFEPVAAVITEAITNDDNQEGEGVGQSHCIVSWQSYKDYKLGNRAT